jgi:hypothetical protein
MTLHPAFKFAAKERFDWGRAVRANPNLPPAAKVIASVLVDFANRTTAECFPSIETIADASGLKRRATLDNLAILKKAGWLVSEGRGGRWRTNFYYFRDPDEYDTVRHGAPFASRVTDITVHDDAQNGARGSTNDAPKGTKECAAMHLNQDNQKGKESLTSDDASASADIQRMQDTKPKKMAMRFDQITADIAAFLGWHRMVNLSPEQTNEMCVRWHAGELSPANIEAYYEALLETGDKQASA